VSARSALVLLLALGCGRAGAEPSPPDAATVQAPDVGTDASATRAFDDCAGCHTREASSHAGSMHAQAFDDPLFQREWSRGRQAWCVRCHAPLARDAGDPRVHEGVGCASCHVVDGVIVSRASRGGAPHATRTEPRFSEAAQCGTCHEFDFPARAGRAEQLQRTLSEWRAGGRDERCIDCHMPTLADDGSHALRGPRDPELLSDALDVRVEAARRGSDIVVRAALGVHGAGHAVPTGDLNRRLVFRAWASGAAPVEMEMARLFDRDEDGDAVEIADQRVLPGTDRRLEARLRPRGAVTRVHWSLRWYALAADATSDLDVIPITMLERDVAHGSVSIRR
jgi:hypothetical protein